MTTPINSGEPLVIASKHPTDGPLYQRIAAHIRAAILAGDLPSNSRLPSTRTMARDHNCSRYPVNAAIDLLKSEGIVESRHGSGIYVAQELVNMSRRTPSKPLASACIEQKSCDQKKIKDSLPYTNDIPTGCGIFSHHPDISLFPFKVWSNLLKEYWHAPPEKDIREQDPAGFRPLREAIANHLALWRGLSVSGDDIVITSGTTPALNLVTRIVLQKNDKALVEEPGFRQAMHALNLIGAEAIPIPVDDNGLVFDSLLKNTQAAKAAYVTPSHQHPLGSVLSIRRRQELLYWADNNDAYIFEDDHDAEIRYNGLPLAPLKSIDQNDRTIYLGTFSKTMFHSLRLGFMIPPKQLMTKILAENRRQNHCISITEQPAMARFIAEGHFARHVRRVRTLYERRRNALVDLLRNKLKKGIQLHYDEAGTHVVLVFDRSALPKSDWIVSRALAKDHINVTPLSDYYYRKKNAKHGLVIGYGSTEIKDYESAVTKIATSLYC
ncbi:MAG: PLP-dependent aminotransferase family protein [Pseudomonadota bacterium]